MQEEKKEFLNTPSPSAQEKGTTRLAKIEQRIAELEHRRRAMLAREKEKERKERTRRLIQYGAITCQYLHVSTDIAPDVFEKFMHQVVSVLNTQKTDSFKSADQLQAEQKSKQEE